MTEVHYLRGDATNPMAKGNKIIAHVCNDIGGWGKGFVLAISRHWPEPEREFRAWYRTREGFALGEIQLVQVRQYLWVANMIGQRGIKKGSNGQRPACALPRDRGVPRKARGGGAAPGSLRAHATHRLRSGRRHLGQNRADHRADPHQAGRRRLCLRPGNLRPPTLSDPGLRFKLSN